MRKHTVFTLCEKHKAILSGASRARKAEFMTMGGFVGDNEKPCDCKIRPGVDIFTPSYVAVHPGEYGVHDWPGQM